MPYMKIFSYLCSVKLKDMAKRKSYNHFRGLITWLSLVLFGAGYITDNVPMVIISGGVLFVLFIAAISRFMSLCEQIGIKENSMY